MGHAEEGAALVGTTIDGRFDIDAMLGQGGMGTVYRGTQKSVGRPVAIKTLRAKLTRSEDAVKRFHREVSLVSRLNHPNVVSVIDFGTTNDGLLYLVMELVQGPTLQMELARGPLSLRRAVGIVSQVCDALTEAHALGIVHRDLKPENIVLTDHASRRDIVKVLDFGVATVVEEGNPSGTRITRNGAIVGTPLYMSPEQVSGVGALSSASDLYALTLILLEMLTGKQAFLEDSPAQVMVAQVTSRAPTLREQAPDLQWSPDLESFVAQQLSKMPQLRVQDAQTYKHMLVAAASGRTFDEARNVASDAFLALGPDTERGHRNQGLAELAGATTEDALRSHWPEVATVIAHKRPVRALGEASKAIADEQLASDVAAAEVPYAASGPVPDDVVVVPRRTEGYVPYAVALAAALPTLGPAVPQQQIAPLAAGLGEAAKPALATPADPATESARAAAVTVAPAPAVETGLPLPGLSGH